MSRRDRLTSSCAWPKSWGASLSGQGGGSAMRPARREWPASLGLRRAASGRDAAWSSQVVHAPQGRVQLPRLAPIRHRAALVGQRLAASVVSTLGTASRRCRLGNAVGRRVGRAITNRALLFHHSPICSTVRAGRGLRGEVSSRPKPSFTDQDDPWSLQVMAVGGTAMSVGGWWKLGRFPAPS